MYHVRPPTDEDYADISAAAALAQAFEDGVASRRITSLEDARHYMKQAGAIASQLCADPEWIIDDAGWIDHKATGARTLVQRDLARQLAAGSP